MVNGVKVIAPEKVAQASRPGCDVGEAVWLRACRNSAISRTKAYEKAVEQAKAVLGGRQVEILIAF
jgi:hypothetical protein